MIPHATFSADQGTTPTSRRTDNRTHAGVPPEDADKSLDCADFGPTTEEEEEEKASPSRACLVISTGRGKTRDKVGARGMARRVENIEPRLVSRVITRVASKGWKRAPARTFYSMRFRRKRSYRISYSDMTLVR